MVMLERTRPSPPPPHPAPIPQDQPNSSPSTAQEGAGFQCESLRFCKWRTGYGNLRPGSIFRNISASQFSACNNPSFYSFSTCAQNPPWTSESTFEMLQSGELSNTSMTHLASREGHSQSLGEENMEKPQLKGCSSFREIHTEITSGFVFVGSNNDKLNRNRAPKEVLNFQPLSGTWGTVEAGRTWSSPRRVPSWFI